MDFAGSEHPASPTILAGTPATVLQGGTSSSTTEPAAIRLLAYHPSTIALIPLVVDAAGQPVQIIRIIIDCSRLFPVDIPADHFGA